MTYNFTFQTRKYMTKINYLITKYIYSVLLGYGSVKTQLKPDSRELEENLLEICGKGLIHLTKYNKYVRK